jgi:hypothetical protein|nr:hypothetical protein [uncultured Undibacterium sp.]
MSISTNVSTKILSCALLITSFAVSNQAAASLVELKWDEQGRFQHKTEIKAGGMLEVCGKLAAGLKIDWQYKSPLALDFNIHYHEGKKVTLPVKHQARKEVAEQFETKIAQDYCWMWSNKSKQSASIELSLVQAAYKLLPTPVN